MIDSSIDNVKPEQVLNSEQQTNCVVSRPACINTFVGGSTLHRDDPMNLFEFMKNGSVRKWIYAIKQLTGKSLYEMTINEWIDFRKNQWYKCPRLGAKTLQDFDNALKLFYNE